MPDVTNASFRDRAWERRVRGRPPSVRVVLAALLSAAFLCWLLSVWSIHAKYLSREQDATGRSGGWLAEDDTGRRTREGGGVEGEGRLVGTTNNELAADTRHRVYCMVPLIWTPAVLPTYRAIHHSWGQRCHILRFFIDPVVGDAEVGFHNMSEAAGAAAAREAGIEPPDDAVVLHGMRRPWHANCGSPDDEARLREFGNCRNIWEKIWRAVVYVGHGSGGTHVGGDRETDAFKAEWFVKVDADTYLFPENVGRFVDAKGWSHEDQHYFGHVLNHRQEDRGLSIVAGGAVFFSRATLLAAANQFAAMPRDRGGEEEDGTCRDAYTGTDEVVTAACLRERGVTAAPALDPAGREYVALYDVGDLLGYNRTSQGEWWFWEGKERFPCHDAGDCLAHLPLAFHNYKSAKDLLDLEEEFYGAAATGTDDGTSTVVGRVATLRWWNNFNQTKRYFDHVRAAMKEAKRKESRSLAT